MKNINDDIGCLVKKGFPIKVQQSLDIVRVIGNNAIHPRQIYLTDNIEIVSKFLILINIIGDEMITQPKEVDNLYNSLPPSMLDVIKHKDIN